MRQRSGAPLQLHHAGTSWLSNSHYPDGHIGYRTNKPFLPNVRELLSLGCLKTLDNIQVMVSHFGAYNDIIGTNADALLCLSTISIADTICWYLKHSQFFSLTIYVAV